MISVRRTDFRRGREKKSWQGVNEKLVLKMWKWKWRGRGRGRGHLHWVTVPHVLLGTQTFNQSGRGGVRHNSLKRFKIEDHRKEKHLMLQKLAYYLAPPLKNAPVRTPVDVPRIFMTHETRLPTTEEWSSSKFRQTKKRPPANISSESVR